MPTVVLLHALPFDSSMWENVRAALGSRAEVVAPDLFTLGPRLADWATAVLEMTSSTELVVVGNSVGGSCALEVAAAAPKRVEHLVLVGAKAGVRPEPKARDHPIRLLEREGVAGGWETFWRPLFGPSTPPSVLTAAERLALDQEVSSIINGVQAFHNRNDRSGLIQEWAGPVTVVSGALDTAPTPAVAMRSAVGPRATAEVVDDCGHYVSLEAPERFIDLLRTAVGAIA